MSQLVSGIGTSSGLLERAADGNPVVTTAARAWLESGDNETLVRAFHGSIRYVGELLIELNNGAHSTEELRAAAVDRWGMNWGTKDQVHRRLKLLQAAGLVEQTFNHKLLLTEDGRVLLESLDVQDNELISSTSDAVDVTLPDLPPAVLDALSEITEPGRANRRRVIGYVPSGGKRAAETLGRLVDMLTPRAARRVFEQQLSADFGVSGASAASVIQMLKNTGLAEQVSLEDFSPTAIAAAWMESGDPVVLAYILHSRFKFVAELLTELEYADRVPALAAAAKEKYGFRSNSNQEIRTRIHMLLAAGLVRETGWGRYEATALGRAFRESVPLESPEMEDAQPTEDREPTRAEALAERLRSTARDSDHPERFEQAVADAFRYLGFTAEWVGGPGKTDVLVTAIVGPKQSVRAVVDAKSAGGGNVQENRVQFDTLDEHKRFHNADYVVVVGERFDGRISQRAKRLGVALATLDRLVDLIVKHDPTPLSPAELLPLLSAATNVDTEIAQARSARQRQAELVTGVLSQLALEASQDDEVTKGAVTVETLYLLLRSSDINPVASPDELDATLALLSSPFVGAVSRSENRQFILAASPQVAAHRLRALAEAAAAVTEDETE